MIKEKVRTRLKDKSKVRRKRENSQGIRREVKGRIRKGEEVATEKRVKIEEGKRRVRMKASRIKRIMI